MTLHPSAVFGSLAVSAAAVVVWMVLLVRMYWAMEHEKEERRPFIFAMPVVGILASVGYMASAIGLADVAGVFSVPFPPETLSFISGMGRGALLIGGILALAYYHPGSGRK